MTATPESQRLRISALIPAYNAEATLGRALRSILGQTRKADEIVVVDDGSTDGTARIAESFPGVRLIRFAANRRQVAALNAGIAAATGDWIAFLDADDEWHRDKLALSERALLAEPEAVMLTTGGHWVSPAGVRHGAWGSEPPRWGGHVFFKTQLAMNYCAKPAVVARKAVLLAVGGFSEPIPCEDLDMWIKLALAGPVVTLADDLIQVHETAGSIMKTHKDGPWQMLRLIERHVRAAGDRLTPSERRFIMGSRYTEAGRQLIAAGRRGAGMRLLARAIVRGVDPLANLWYPITSLPWLAPLKRRARRLLGHG